MPPRALLGDDLDRAFQSALKAVDERNYQFLEEILDSHPALESYSESVDCSLYCEFSQLLRSPMEDEIYAGIDGRAIEILLDRGWSASSSPDALGAILVSANVFHGDVDEFPINSGVCTENRAQAFPLANRMISAGAPLDASQATTRNLKFTIGFFYTYQLCHRPFICGADYEFAAANIALEVSNSLTSAERDLLRKLVVDKALSPACVLHIVLSHEAL